MYMPQILTLTLQMTQYIALTRFVRETSKKVKREARQKSEKFLGMGEVPPQPPLSTYRSLLPSNSKMAIG